MTRTTTTDPRIETLARELRDEEDGATGWHNTTERHKAVMLMIATRYISIIDKVDPLRIAVRSFTNAA
jgi:hypothetical protein